MWEPLSKKKKEADNSDSEDDVPRTVASEAEKDAKSFKTNDEMQAEENGNATYSCTIFCLQPNINFLMT